MTTDKPSYMSDNTIFETFRRHFKELEPLCIE